MLLQHVVGQHLLQIDPRHKCPAAARRRAQPVDDLQLVLQILRVRRGEFGSLRHLVLVGRIEQRERRGAAGRDQRQRGRQPQTRGSTGSPRPCQRRRQFARGSIDAGAPSRCRGPPGQDE